MVYQEQMVVETIKKIGPQKTILLGAHGMLGQALQRILPNARSFSHEELDITDEDLVLKILKNERPSVVINAAAYTDVDGCEDNRKMAFEVNGDAPGYIAAACSEAGAILVHYSTDYVFAGLMQEYREDDTPVPVNIYGESKRYGEMKIKKNLDDYRIIRTSWLFGSNGKNFVNSILALSKTMEHVRVVNDQIGKPTYTVDLARKTTEIISDKPGIYHITNEGICSWFEFASAFIPNAVACSTEEFPRKAKRPAYSVLVNTKTAPLRHWKLALADYINEMK